MEDSSPGVRCLRCLLRPVARFCLRHSIKLQDFIEVLKGVMVEVAQEHLCERDIDVSTSRLSVMTGVHRKDVVRFRSGGVGEKKSGDIIKRIIGQWRGNNAFLNSSGKPKVLSFDSAEGEFADLIHSVSRELNPYTLLFELERTGAVERTKRGVKLRARMHLPKGDLKEGLLLLESDTEDLIASVEENLFGDLEIPNLHVKTEYDNVPKSAELEIRKWFIEEGSAFHQRARSYLSAYDRDINPGSGNAEEAIRVVVGAFSRVDVASF